MVPESTTESVAHIVQLAVTPAFLLTGIGATLGVLTSRLGRVIDRARWIEDQEPPGIAIVADMRVEPN